MSSDSKASKSDQEVFWAGSFGNEYIARNEDTPESLAANLHFFSRSLQRAGTIASCIEFGANIGLNLRAMQVLFPGLALRGVEINRSASDRLAALIGSDNVAQTSVFDYEVGETFDLAIVKGVLIHLDPARLPEAYEKIVRASRRWILVAEYYSPNPVSVPYRGHSEKLFKRDFAGELLDLYPTLSLVDYGFAYRRDPAFPQDDLTWFLLEKTHDARQRTDEARVLR
jgi:spore coat polysaccharide biosynthesis protein SpsF